VKQAAKKSKARPRAGARRPPPRQARQAAPRPGKGQPATTVEQLAPDDAVLREFIADLYAAMAMMRLVRQEIAAALSLTAAEYSVLLAVWYLERKGEMTVRAIADHLHVAAAYVTSEVGRLVDKGFLIKRPHPADRRAVGVALTKSGREVLLRLGPMLREINAPLLKGVHYRDLVTVHRFLRSIIDHGYDAMRVAQSFTRDRRASARQGRQSAR
jgi:DNA-binding MarR family transcriptional regulator